MTTEDSKNISDDDSITLNQGWGPSKCTALWTPWVACPWSQSVLQGTVCLCLATLLFSELASFQAAFPHWQLKTCISGKERSSPWWYQEMVAHNFYSTLPDNFSSTQTIRTERENDGSKMKNKVEETDQRRMYAGKSSNKYLLCLCEQ